MKNYSNFRNVEELKAYTARVEKATEQANQVFETAKGLMTKWDGKMLNKRFATQLQDLFPETYTEKGNGWREDEIYIYKYISIYYGQEWENKNFHISIAKCGYDVQDEINTMFVFRKTSNYYTGVLTSDDRIKADECIKELQRLQGHNNELVWRYNDAIKNWNKYTKAYNLALENLWATIRMMNPFFVPY